MQLLQIGNLVFRSMMTRVMVHLMSGVLLLVVSSYAVEESIPYKYMNDTRRIPEIKQGEKCIKGQLYKMDCNTCHCGPQSTLLCTKMGCLNSVKGPGAPGGSLRSGQLGTKQPNCTAGKLYKKGCRQCFCTEKKRLKCSGVNCKLAERSYVNPERVQPLKPEEFYKLPSLPHTASKCNPGSTYRIDCNACFCLESKNLMCQKLLCPSYEDFYRLKAQEMSGKPCNASTTQDCVECQCQDSKYACEAQPAACRHADGRRKLHGEFPSDHDRNFIDVNHMKEQCKAGMVYKVHCNKCYCQDDGSMRCTQKSCLNYSEVERLNKLKAKLNKDPESADDSDSDLEDGASDQEEGSSDSDEMKPASH